MYSRNEVIEQQTLSQLQWVKRRDLMPHRKKKKKHKKWEKMKVASFSPEFILFLRSRVLQINIFTI